MYKGVGGWGRWEAGGGLHHLTGLFGVAMSPRSAGHRPRHDWRALRDVSPTQLGEYQIHTSHLVPSMGPIVSVVTLHGRQNQL